MPPNTSIKQRLRRVLSLGPSGSGEKWSRWSLSQWGHRPSPLLLPPHSTNLLRPSAHGRLWFFFFKFLLYFRLVNIQRCISFQVGDMENMLFLSIPRALPQPTPQAFSTVPISLSEVKGFNPTSPPLASIELVPHLTGNNLSTRLLPSSS